MKNSRRSDDEDTTAIVLKFLAIAIGWAVSWWKGSSGRR
jgi:hypothetical protein